MNYKMIMILCIAGMFAMAGSVYAGNGNNEEHITNAHVDGYVYYGNMNQPINGAFVTAYCNEDSGTTYTHINGAKEGELNMELKCPINSTVTVVVDADDIGTTTVTGLVKQFGKSNVGEVKFNIGINTAPNPNAPEFPIGIMPAMMTVLGIGLAGRKF